MLTIHRIEANPTVDFTIIINPDSGPGPNALPDGNYITGITALNKHPNVKLVGYGLLLHST
jgi:hypothetical protein